MNKLRKFFIAAVIFTSAATLREANARESFYNLSSPEPSIIINLNALNYLEPPAYADQPPAPVKRHRSQTKGSFQAQPAKRAPKVQSMPVISDNIEAPRTPAPAPLAPPPKLPHAAPPLPDTSSDLPPPPPLMPPAKQQKLPKVDEAPVKMAPPPPPIPEVTSAPSRKMDDLPPPPPPLPKVDSSTNAAPMPKVIVSNKPLPQPIKNTDNIVALPPAPLTPPPPVNDKKLVAASRDLPSPPPLPPISDDNLVLPPPLPPSPPVNIDKKIADEKAKIAAEQVKSKTAVKNAAAKMPTPKDLASAEPAIPDLPPIPAPPPPMDVNGLPPLPGASSNNSSVGSSLGKTTDLPPLDNIAGKKQAKTTLVDEPKVAAPDKTTVTMQSSKPATPSSNGAITMAYSEAETEIPLVEKSKLDSVVSQLETDKSKTVTLVAYASGTPEQASQAKRTSLARVLAIRKYMMERNIDPDRINPRPLGNKAEGGVPDRVDIIVQSGART